MVITIQSLQYIYDSTSEPAIDCLSATFAEGWTGIVGENGAGKSTLLSLVCGDLVPTAGTIRPVVSGIYCAQATETPPRDMEDFIYDYSSEAVELRRILRLEDEWFWRYDTLSHGERKRIQIACALRLRPALLALDEPTNHLDARTKKLVLETLQAYQGIGLLVSHDREFLDKLVYQCLFMSKGQASLVPGTYTQGRRQLEIDHKATVAKRKNAREELSRVKAEGIRRQAEASKASSRRSARHLDKGDRDGRAKIKLAIYTGQDGKTGLLSSQMDKKVEAAQKNLEEAFVDKRYEKPLELKAAPAARKVLLKIKEGFLPLGGERTLYFPEIYIGNTDRIGLWGENGTGKSTFIRENLGTLLDGPHTVYIPQEMTAEQGKGVLEKLRDLPQGKLGSVLSIVARLNSPPSRILSGDALSPGELRKAMLACGLLEEPYLIIMDEPTNHLDINSIEALQEVLTACPCALILVSHDKQFLEALTDIRWDFSDSIPLSDHGLEKPAGREGRAPSRKGKEPKEGDVELKVELV